MLRLLSTLLLLLPPTLTAQQWTRLGDLKTPRTNHAAVYIGSGQVMVIGGSTGIPDELDPHAIPVASCEIIDVWNRRVMPAAPMTFPRSEFVALRTRDSNIIVIGGVTGPDRNGPVTATVEEYDRRDRVWRMIGVLKTARRQHSAGFIDEHRILVVGGRRQDYSTLTDAEIFDLRTGLSTPAAEFPYAINGSTLIASFSGDLVVVGGRTGGKNSERRAEVYAYDARNDEWVLNSALAQAITGVSGLRLWDRRIVIAGGANKDSPLQPANEVQLENIGKWKLISPMTTPRTDAVMAQWTENRILVIGGTHISLTPLASTEWIDMSGRRSRPGPTLAVGHSRCAALSVPSYRGAEPHLHSVVVIGGMATSTTLTGAIELLEPLE